MPLTRAQQEAHRKAFDACDYTVEGRFNKGAIVADYLDNTWRIATRGIRYHEDVTSAIYGVKPARPPKGWKNTIELRAVIENLLGEVQEPGSRAGTPETQRPRPSGKKIMEWQDGRPGSLASFPVLTIYENGIIGVYKPIYDDAPIMKWAQDKRLAKRLSKIITSTPRPVHLAQVDVKERETRLKIAPDHPRYDAYVAGRGAHVAPYSDDILIPRTEYRRIEAELDDPEKAEKSLVGKIKTGDLAPTDLPALIEFFGKKGKPPALEMTFEEWVAAGRPKMSKKAKAVVTVLEELYDEYQQTRRSNPRTEPRTEAEEDALDLYEDFNMQGPKKGFSKITLSLPAKNEPLVWLGKMAEIVYESDKEGIEGQLYVHKLDEPWPDIYSTHDRQTLIIPIHDANLILEDGWMRG